MNVLLVNHYPEHQHEILAQVIDELKTLNGGHRYRLVHDLKPRARHFLWTLGLPTRVVSFYQLRAFQPDWAVVWTQRALTKSVEYEILDRAGIPVPRWAKLTSLDSKPDLSAFSDYVVVKPDWGCCGALIRVRSKNAVRWEKLPTLERAPHRISEALIVQDYVHTGSWPVSYRVGTVFGEPIYAWRITGDKSRSPFEERKRNARFFNGRSIVSNTKRSLFDTQVPEDVIDFAGKVHTAFPSIPLLGTDIIRDADTGKLYALDMNTNGNTFHLTSDAGKSISRDFNLDLSAQFGGAKAIARGIFQRLSSSESEIASIASLSRNDVIIPDWGPSWVRRPQAGEAISNSRDLVKS